jgi:hypothetical protein
MEAIPKLAMVSFDPKQSPENLDFASKLRQQIAEKFGEDPNTFAKEIKELETLRANSCIRISETIDGVATLKKYYCQLIFLQNRYRKPFNVMYRWVRYRYYWNKNMSKCNKRQGVVHTGIPVPVIIQYRYRSGKYLSLYVG